MEEENINENKKELVKNQKNKEILLTNLRKRSLLFWIEANKRSKKTLAKLYEK
jgi:hypothetical protein